MCTSTPPLASARKLASKRRRLNYAMDPGYHPGRALTDNSNFVPAFPLCPKLSCSTCHRSLSTAIRPSAVASFVCSRCSAPTCAICTRTCTSYTRPSSLPPTPALTRSPSPSTHVHTPVSPKRTALSPSHAVMNCDTAISVILALPPVPPTKRKNAPSEKDVDGDGDLDGTAWRDQYHTTSTHGGATESTVIPGCGRVVCRACCIESIPNDGKLCVDCFALV